jgi:hypothetical protein
MNEDEKTKPRSPFQMKIGDAVAKATISLDQTILKLKELYDLMPDEERNILRSWIAQLVPLHRNPVCTLIGKARVSLRYPSSPEEGIVVDGLPPITIVRAIESWERGEAYNPGSLRELGWA